LPYSPSGLPFRRRVGPLWYVRRHVPQIERLARFDPEGLEQADGAVLSAIQDNELIFDTGHQALNLKPAVFVRGVLLLVPNVWRKRNGVWLRAVGRFCLNVWAESGSPPGEKLNARQQFPPGY
jgi:hypothetical protein